jgi:hypothetical protein
MHGDRRSYLLFVVSVFFSLVCMAGCGDLKSIEDPSTDTDSDTDTDTDTDSDTDTDTDTDTDADPRTDAEVCGPSECGTVEDYNGIARTCGTCISPEICNTVTDQCETDCTPQSCFDQGHECGTFDDGCEDTVNCGTCASGYDCVLGSCFASPADAPSLSLNSQDGDSFTLRWTYDWGGGLVSSQDNYRLEQSTTSSSSGFVQVLQTPANDRTSPWDETLVRENGTYYYRVRAYKGGTVSYSSYSNIVEVDVAVQPAKVRIVNDLYDQVAGSNDWPKWNQLLRVWIAGSESAMSSCTDACDRLDPATVSLPGEVITPNQGGSSWREFDVSMYTDGEYVVYLQVGWWEYFCPSSCYWTEHVTAVLCCNGTDTCYKYESIRVQDHFDGTFTLYASDFLPDGHWYLSPFCS